MSDPKERLQAYAHEVTDRPTEAEFREVILPSRVADAEARITDALPEGMTASFAPPPWLLERYADLIPNASFMFNHGPRPPLTRWQRIRRTTRSKWFDARYWLSQKICKTSDY